MVKNALICAILVMPCAVTTSTAQPNIEFNVAAAPVRPAAPQALPAGPSERLLTEIVDWLAAEFQLPASDRHPRVATIDPAEMLQRRYRGMLRPPASPAPNATAGDDLVAIYEDTTRTIYLQRGWTGRTPAEMSVLVHEMVHHLQNRAGLKYDCPQMREKLAYAAQQKWLEKVGRDYFVEFETDPMTLLLRTACAY